MKKLFISIFLILSLFFIVSCKSNEDIKNFNAKQTDTKIELANFYLQKDFLEFFAKLNDYAQNSKYFNFNLVAKLYENENNYLNIDGNLNITPNNNLSFFTKMIANLNIDFKKENNKLNLKAKITHDGDFSKSGFVSYQGSGVINGKEKNFKFEGDKIEPELEKILKEDIFSSFKNIEKDTKNIYDIYKNLQHLYIYKQGKKYYLDMENSYLVLDIKNTSLGIKTKNNKFFAQITLY